MKAALHIFSVFAVASLCSGCWPMRFTTSPGATGIVLDAQTRAPIAGAEVVVSRAAYRSPVITNAATGVVEPVPYKLEQLLPPSSREAITNARLPLAVTGADGRFSIPAEKQWGIYIVPMDLFPFYETLLVRREGYADAMKLLVFPPATTNGGEIQLIRQR